MTAAAPPQSPATSGTRPALLIALFLLIAVALVYGRTAGQDFILLDDCEYITCNPYVQRGLSSEGLAFAFRLTHRNTYWHPLTWLSLMLSQELHGLNPGAYKLTNAGLHAAAALVLFFALRRLTGRLWPSALAAALFALHPLNVESVAWATERKNVLSGLLWMLTLWTYALYAKSPNRLKYLAVGLFLAATLLAKPALLTLPFVLLLLDYWPLGRLTADAAGHAPRPGRVIAEKIPFLAVAAVICAAVMYSIFKTGIAVPIRNTPLDLRLANALVSYARYLGKIVWPADLALFYPFPGGIPFWKTTLAALLLGLLTLAAWRTKRRAPYVLIGWLWFLGVMFPAGGLVQGGTWPALADRFTYLPAVGLYILAAWGAADLAVKVRLKPALGLAAAGLVLLGLGLGAWFQAGLWRSETLLFSRALEISGP
ncbi:MAG: hypothetical protein AB1896_20135, partial [Thermodesulfobacteriota bacterium]